MKETFLFLLIFISCLTYGSNSAKTKDKWRNPSCHVFDYRTEWVRDGACHWTRDIFNWSIPPFECRALWHSSTLVTEHTLRPIFRNVIEDLYDNLNELTRYELLQTCEKFGVSSEDELMSYLSQQDLSFWIEHCKPFLYIEDVIWALRHEVTNHTQLAEEIHRLLPPCDAKNTPDEFQFPLEICFCEAKGRKRTFLHVGLFGTIEITPLLPPLPPPLEKEPSFKTTKYEEFRVRYPECIPDIPKISMEELFAGPPGRSDGPEVQRELSRILNGTDLQSTCPPLHALLGNLSLSEEKWMATSYERSAKFTRFGARNVTLAMMKQAFGKADDSPRRNSNSHWHSYELARLLTLDHVLTPSATFVLDGSSATLSQYVPFLPINWNLTDEEYVRKVIPLDLLKLAKILKRSHHKGAVEFGLLSMSLGWDTHGLYEDLPRYSLSMEQVYLASQWAKKIPASSIEDMVLLCMILDLGDLNDGNLVLYYDPERDVLDMKMIDYDHWFAGLFETLDKSHAITNIANNIGRLPHLQRPFQHVTATLDRLNRTNLTACIDLMPEFPFEARMNKLIQVLRQHAGSTLSDVISRIGHFWSFRSLPKIVSTMKQVELEYYCDTFLQTEDEAALAKYIVARFREWRKNDHMVIGRRVDDAKTKPTAALFQKYIDQLRISHSRSPEVLDVMEQDLLPLLAPLGHAQDKGPDDDQNMATGEDADESIMTAPAPDMAMSPSAEHLKEKVTQRAMMV